MPPKKRDKDLENPNVEVDEADKMLFLQSFEKPTRIYRFLMTRNVISDKGEFNLEFLKDYIDSLLHTTEMTKKFLQLECKEAKNVLKPWPIETTVLKEVDKKICKCDECITQKEREEEVANNIEQMILQAQQLRQRSINNLSREKYEARKPSLTEIYGPTAQKRSINTNLINKNGTLEKPIKSLPRQKTNSILTNNEYGSLSNARDTNSVKPSKTENLSSAAELSKSIKSQKNKTSTNSQLEPSKENHLAKKFLSNNKVQKNFILANKLSVKSSTSSQRDKKLLTNENYLKSTSSKDSVNNNNNSSIKSANKVENIQNINNLFEKMKIETLEQISVTQSECLFKKFNSNASNNIEEKVITRVDAAEGLDRFGIPSDLLKILRIYHSYVTKGDKYNSKEDQDDSYLKKFATFNKKSQLRYPKELVKLLSECSALLEKSYENVTEDSEVKILFQKYHHLRKLFKKLKIDESSLKIDDLFNEKDKLCESRIPDSKNWSSLGLWNYFCVPEMIENIKGAECLKYADEKSLLEFYISQQEFQRKLYESNLLDILILLVIPQLKEYVNPKSKEYIEIYKMLATILHILNPTVPVLVSTDEY